MVHITGGGFQENIPRILPEGLAAKVEMGTWDIPPIFKLLQKWGNVADLEMFRTFNMGLGLVLAVPEDAADKIITEINSANLAKAQRIGRLEKGERRTILEGL
jgi:phosphoribosylformylglycinamidine cyclo-ligase